MENNARAAASLGPRGAAGAPPLSRSRAAILERLRDQPEPLRLAALVTATGLHENTVREHLDALVRRGLVRQHRAEPAGRGRPAWLYEAAGAESAPSSEYAGLAAALAASLARTPAPVELATGAGEDWGQQLAVDRGAAPASPASPEAARAEVVTLLDDLGFAPEVAADRPDEVRLTRCPLLEAAHRHPDVVCAVHLGIVRGALTAHGADAEGTELLPFAEPGACKLVVPPVRPTVRPPVRPAVRSAAS
ncbi:MAG: helix-turn-helix domain-containing protein [Nocardioides sp.]